MTSVAWDGEKISYYAHEDRKTEPPFRKLPAFVGEWLFIWTRFWIRVIPRIPLGLTRRIFRHDTQRRASNR